ncbi:hypothetical protein J2Y54_002402 [Sphingomonas sp. BE123]|uniref:hypothetical protein n=1 Tax=Sphingomonas sp. BE123 TaxID=2817842 RepID=UPI0028545DD9|nr:hypothetical protein [Sphingomonas sp. BE123]MDR6852882.1 hypothetical protein [Sphingomonas sp. BE123]
MSGAHAAPRGRMAAPMAGLRTGYITLFDVRFEHGFYNAGGGACPDLRVVPTPACAALMRQLNMVFRDHGTGFSVLVNAARAEAMIAFLRSSYANGPQGRGFWSRLSFQLVATNPGFVGMTRLPITTNLMTDNLHLDNRSASAAAGRMQVEAGGADALVPLAGTGWAVPTPAGRTAALLDLSGAPVAARTSVSDAVTRFDLTGLPYGLYSVAVTGRTGRPIAPRGPGATRLYLPRTPVSLALLDLLLTQPVPGAGDPAAYPVSPMAAPAARGAATPPATIRPVALTIGFQSRATYWHYYIVARGRGQFADDLAITGGDVSFAKSRAALPNGDRAILFTAATALPLHQHAPQCFRLSGHRQGATGARDPISVARLPTAPPAPVWPVAGGGALSGSSEIYVYV